MLHDGIYDCSHVLVFRKYKLLSLMPSLQNMLLWHFSDIENVHGISRERRGQTLLLGIIVPASKLVQTKRKINVKRGLNSTAKPWAQFNYNITYEFNCKFFTSIFTEIIYSILYNTAIIKNWDMWLIIIMILFLLLNSNIYLATSTKYI